MFSFTQTPKRQVFEAEAPFFIDFLNVSLVYDNNQYNK